MVRNADIHSIRNERPLPTINDLLFFAQGSNRFYWLIQLRNWRRIETDDGI